MQDVAFPIVGIGASAGGLEAFTQLLKQLPPTTGMAFVLIQHLDPTHESHLREAMAKATVMAVTVLEESTPVEPNHVYVIPPNADIELKAGLLVLVGRESDSRRPHLPIDFFFQSLAADRGSHAVGVVLSGTASDGTEGLRAIKAENGITFAQEPESARFAEMPQNAVNAGVVDRVLAIPSLAAELVRLSRDPYVAGPGVPHSADDGTTISQILMVVRNAVGVDFTEFKQGTIERRLGRRMALRRANDLEAYSTLLQGDPDEVRALYEDLLIHVSSFFRDPEAFAALAAHTLPAILKNKAPDAPIRIWIAGCSTGEEVYSIGILLLELLGDSRRPVQIFGSDLSEPVITKARAGIYSDGALRDVSDERRRRFFLKTERGYKINKVVRDLCVFVQHDLARDPAFSKLDLVSCRNVLIYFDDALQKRVVRSFHYSLNPTGYLLLGRTESISGFSQLFSTVDKANKIFGRTALPSTLRFSPRSEARQAESRAESELLPVQARRAVDVAKHLDRLLLARYAPPGVLINENLEILQFRGQTGSFLQAAPGEPQNNLIKMARHGLLSALRDAIAQAKKDKAPVKREGVEVDQDGFTRTCNLVVFPLTGLPEAGEPLYVVLFEAATIALSPVERRRSSEPLTADSRLPKVEHELIATKEYMQALIEEHGRTNDNLGTANEELISGNEELQSMNEELETAKEELQSTNEELTTVNDELQVRNQEVTLANGDLLNLLLTVDIPIVILDLDRRIRRFTPRAKHLFNLIPSDHGRLIDDIKPNLDVPDLDSQIAEVIETLEMKESEVQDRQGRWHRMQIRPYKTTDNKIDGAIVSLVDIDSLKQHIGEAQLARADAERANNAKDVFLAILGHELRTPLSSLLLHAQMLRRGAVVDPVKLSRIGESMERGTRQQVQLIDDLLDVSRIVAGKLQVQLEPLDLCMLVRSAIETVSGAAERKSIQLDVLMDDDLGLVPGDPLRLQQVVSNLLTNAIKFTPKGGRISVTVDCSGEWARIEVTDSGSGISAEFLPHVFHRFSQEDSSKTRPHGGLGLGLAIVQHLVEQHGGTVRADSRGAGLGSTFTVVLPLAKGDEEDVVISTRFPVANDQQRIDDVKDLPVLVVDDDSATLEAVADMLREMGANVRTADSAAAAVAAIRESRPALLLCDIAMPGEDGYSFIRKLRAFRPDEGGDIPALAITALAAEQDRQDALGAGFQMFLTKPVDMDRLSKAVAELAGRRGLSPGTEPTTELSTPSAQ